MTLEGVPVVIQAWVRQMLSDEVVDIIRMHPDAQLDIRLSAAGGRVRARPALVINGGTTALVDPMEIMEIIGVPVKEPSIRT